MVVLTCLVLSPDQTQEDVLVKITTKILKVMLTLALFSGLYSCTEVGSEKWCKKMEEKPTDKWTIAETKDYTRHCVFK
jgi:hypothetical protein